MKSNRMFTISSAAREYDVSRQAITLIIRNKRLNAIKKKHRWSFTQEDWEKYQSSRYDRRYSKRNGKLLYNPENGIISPRMLANELNVHIQHIYYLIRTGKIPVKRSKSAYVINRNDIPNIHEIVRASHKRTGPKKHGSGNQGHHKGRGKNAYKKISRI